MYQELLGKLLIASPGLQDVRFQNSVILICEHSKEVVMGLILNKPLHNFDINQIFKKLKIKYNTDIDINNIPTFFGGPVQLNQGFIIHSNEKKYSTTEKIIQEVMITTSDEILKDISQKQSPKFTRVFLGCSVWNYDQLNNEILENSWIITDSSKEIIFDSPIGLELWKKSLISIGVDPNKLISYAGNA